MIKRFSTFSLDYDRLEKAVLSVYRAAEARGGIFEHGLERYLPQWGIPEEMEHSPQRMETKDPEEASRYLWTMASLERKSLTRVNISNGRRVWKDPNQRWVFHPEEVVNKGLDAVRRVFTEEFRYTLNGFPENYMYNAMRLFRNYSNDPRKVVEGKTVAQARESLIHFAGIGTGISNLYLLYLTDRHITSPTDPENLLLKVDVHKSRIPINTEAVTSKEDFIRRDLIVSVLERAYWKICKKHDLDAGLLDSALWITGSEVCAKRDYEACLSSCSLASELCTACIPEDENLGKFIVRINGQRNDVRKNSNHAYMDFFSKVPHARRNGLKKDEDSGDNSKDESGLNPASDHPELFKSE